MFRICSVVHSRDAWFRTITGRYLYPRSVSRSLWSLDTDLHEGQHSHDYIAMQPARDRRILPYYSPTKKGWGQKRIHPFFISWEKIIAGRGQVRLGPLPDNCPIKRVRRSRVLLAPPLLASALAPHWMAATRAGTLNPNATADGSNTIPSEQKRRRKG